MTTPGTAPLTPHEAVALYCLGRFRRPLAALELARAMNRMAVATTEQGAHRIGARLADKGLAEKFLDDADRGHECVPRDAGYHGDPVPAP